MRQELQLQLDLGCGPIRAPKMPSRKYRVSQSDCYPTQSWWEMQLEVHGDDAFLADTDFTLTPHVPPHPSYEPLDSCSYRGWTIEIDELDVGMVIITLTSPKGREYCDCVDKYSDEFDELGLNKVTSIQDRRKYEYPNLVAYARSAIDSAMTENGR